MTTLGGILISSVIIIATAIIAWFAKPIVEKNKDLVSKAIEEDFQLHSQPEHHIVVGDNTEHDNIQSPESKIIDVEEETKIFGEMNVADGMDLTLDEAEDIQEKLMQDVHSAPKKKHSYHKKVQKKHQASDTQTE